jgi:hypothetical protein
MSNTQFEFAPYASAIRKLLKGVVYHDDPVWIQIRDYELPIREYFDKIGLGVHVGNGLEEIVQVRHMGYNWLDTL